MHHSKTSIDISFLESNELDVATSLISSDGAREAEVEFQMQDPNLVIPTSLSHKHMSNTVSVILKACLHIPSPLGGSFDLFDGPSDRENGCRTHSTRQTTRHH